MNNKVSSKTNEFNASAKTGARFKLLVGLFILCSVVAFGMTKKAHAKTGKKAAVQLSALTVPHNANTNIQKPKLFGTYEKISTNIKPFTKWTSMLARHQKQMRSVDRAVFQAWFERFENLENQPLEVKLRQVNNIVNLNRYIPDQKGWGQSDHWATPVEFLQKQYGDCEDFAITKFLALKALGVPESAMRLAVVHDMQKNIPHAVLIVYAGGQAFLLDNQMKQVVNTAHVSHYKPYYSISKTAWWLHKSNVQTAQLR